MKYINLLILCMFLCFSGYAQSETYYYVDGKKVSILVHDDMLYFSFSEGVDSASANEISKQFGKVVSQGTYKSVVQHNWTMIKMNAQSMRIGRLEIIAKARQETKIQSVQPVIDDTEPIAVSNTFYLKLKKLDDYHLIQEFADENNVEALGNTALMPLWFIFVGKKVLLVTLLN